MTLRSRVRPSRVAEAFWRQTHQGYADLASTKDNFYAYRAELTADLIQRHKAAGSVLDVGCGTGLLSEALARRGFDVYGTDISPQMLRISRERLRALYDDVDNRFRLTDGITPPFPRKFDIVVALGVFPYVPDYPAYIQYLENLLAIDGALVASNTNRRSLFAYKEIIALPFRHNQRRYWKWIAENLFRTGLWSGGYVDQTSANQAYSADEMDRLMATQNFVCQVSLDLYNIPSLDMFNPSLKRSRLGHYFSRRLAWNHIGIFRKSPSRLSRRPR